MEQKRYGSLFLALELSLWNCIQGRQGCEGEAGILHTSTPLVILGEENTNRQKL